jgi:hypothetical protein
MDRRHVARFERAHVDVVYRSAALMVRDVHCSRFHPNSGPEEHSNGHTIVLVRSGLFIKITGGETVLADPTHVLFFTRHQPYHVRIPSSAETGARSCRCGLQTSWTLSGAMHPWTPSVKMRLSPSPGP